MGQCDFAELKEFDTASEFGAYLTMKKISTLVNKGPKEAWASIFLKSLSVAQYKYRNSNYCSYHIAAKRAVTIVARRLEKILWLIIT